jgi:hypothetical protein
MGLIDRDWYWAERARRAQRCLRLARGFRTAVAVATALLAVFASLPIAITSRCDFDTWQTEPGACWRWSWAALSERVAGNMAATRGGWPVAIVRVDHLQR